jgi:hypothetical protein
MEETKSRSLFNGSTKSHNSGSDANRTTASKFVHSKPPQDSDLASAFRIRGPGGHTLARHDHALPTPSLTRTLPSVGEILPHAPRSKDDEIRPLRAVACSQWHNRMRQVRLQPALSQRSASRVPSGGWAPRGGRLLGRPAGGRCL